jgi:DNA-binding HxlR family transcriptional regulator
MTIADLIIAWHGIESARAVHVPRGTKIDLEKLIHVAGMFRFRWDPPVLAVLAERPFRFRALHARLQAQIGDHVDDNALTRSLHRLTTSGLVHIDSTPSGNRTINTYSLSEHGREQLGTYKAIVEAYGRRRPSRNARVTKSDVRPLRQSEHAA